MKPKILLITDEVWNDSIHGSNVMTNWFSEFDAEFANIYCSPGYPKNNICKKYFQVTDKMMFRSLISKTKAGISFQLEYSSEESRGTSNFEEENKALYSNFKKITMEPLRLVRDLIWRYGRYNSFEMEKFVLDFNPDIIFVPRRASTKILRLERILKKTLQKPMVVFTGDDEYSLKQLNFSPFFWIRQLILRKSLRKNMSIYDLYYCHSKEQSNYYSETFKVKSKLLYKSADEFKSTKKKVKYPIKLIYAGKLYCNRWKVLSKIVEAIKKINEKDLKVILEIYTKDNLSSKQYKLLNDNKNTFVMGGISPDELEKKYYDSDIALHVESLDIKNRWLTKYSFSTKIIDCLSSGCAVMAICWNKQTGLRHLKENDGAICITSYEQIYDKLNEITKNTKIIEEYSKKAAQCIVKNHKREKIQFEMMSDFKSLISKSLE